jgi:hypothetical protein
MRTQQHRYRHTDNVGSISTFTAFFTTLLAFEAHSSRKREAAKPNAPALRCGEHGYDGGHAAYIAIISIPTAECPIACNYFADCKMYATSTDPGYCYMYNTEMADNFVAVESSPYIFYEKACGSTSA